MSMPKSISRWFFFVFFLLAGLAAASMPWLTGIFALGAALFLFLGK